MMFYGKGCNKDLNEYYKFLKYHSDNGIDWPLNFQKDILKHIKKNYLIVYRINHSIF